MHCNRQSFSALYLFILFILLYTFLYLFILFDKKKAQTPHRCLRSCPMIFYFLLPNRFLNIKTMYRCRDTTLASDKGIARILVDWHNRCISQQAAEFHRLTNALADNRNQTNRGRLLVDHTDCHLICNNTGDGGGLRVPRDCDHV